MKILDNTTELFGDDLRGELSTKKRIDIAAASFSIHVLRHLKKGFKRWKPFDLFSPVPPSLPIMEQRKVSIANSSFRL